MTLGATAAATVVVFAVTVFKSFFFSFPLESLLNRAHELFLSPT